MTAGVDTDIVARLEGLVASGVLPPKARDQGKSLVDRLLAPVRVAVVGPSQSGKSQLIRLLAGLPAMHDGQAARDGGDIGETPSSLFENLVLIEHGFSKDRKDAGGIEGTAPDIILWCTQGFTHEEAQIWSRVPDNLKDHSFLVLTKADELMRLGMLDDRLDDLCEVVETEFHSLLPLATSQALAARNGARMTDPASYANSGAKALFEALERLIDQGRDAALDSANLFIRRHGTASSSTAADTDVLPTKAVLASAPAPLPAAPAAIPDVTPAPSTAADADAALSERAMRLFAERCEGFPDAIAEGDREAISSLLALCSETAEALSDLVSDCSGISGDLTEDVLEASETMILLTLEDDANAAADAVTLLLQLRRGFETRLAA